MGTKRTPILRRGRPPISPRTLEAFAQMKKLEHECTCGPDDVEDCPACERWRDLAMIIHREQKCRPWQIPCVWPDTGDGSSPARDRYALYCTLERALKTATQRQAARPPPDLTGPAG
jgi:hypothetical protein